MTSSTDPGWYPDPEDASRARYWDGSSWTDRTRPAPGAAQPPAPVARAPAGGPWWRRRPVLLAAAALVVVGVGVLVLTSSENAGAEVILEPTASTGEDPFTDSVAKSDIAVKGGGYKQVKGGDRSIESVSGAAPGLYGGTGDQAACDAKAMVAFLKRNPDKAAAFAGVLGIRPSGIEDYVGKLTPLVLREDTRVTNHGFANGRATELQSVLQAGTAVLVDNRGVPRVRCACGNPLTEPAAVSAAPEFKGGRWDGFDDKRLVAVAPARRPVERFHVVDVRTGKQYVAAAGGAAMSVERLLNLAIPSKTCQLPTVPWRNGHHPDEGSTAPDGTSKVFAQVAGLENGDAEAAVGDLTGDGVTDGALITLEACGGNTVFSNAYAFNADGTLLGRLPVEEVDSTITGLRDIAISSGAVDVTAVIMGACHACPPAGTDRLRFKWDGSGFHPVGVD